MSVWKPGKRVIRKEQERNYRPGRLRTVVELTWTPALLIHACMQPSRPQTRFFFFQLMSILGKARNRVPIVFVLTFSAVVLDFIGLT